MTEAANNGVESLNPASTLVRDLTLQLSVEVHFDFL
jgi:hypothetical protein